MHAFFIQVACLIDVATKKGCPLQFTVFKPVHLSTNFPERQDYTLSFRANVCKFAIVH